MISKKTFLVCWIISFVLVLIGASRTFTALHYLYTGLLHILAQSEILKKIIIGGGLPIIIIYILIASFIYAWVLYFLYITYLHITRALSYRISRSILYGIVSGVIIWLLSMSWKQLPSLIFEPLAFPIYIIQNLTHI
jgi:hypothetical protein